MAVSNPKPVSQMTVGEINKTLDRVDELSRRNTDAFIEAGRVNERPSDYLHLQDPLSREADRLWHMRMELHNEIERRYGPGAPSRLPKGFGPTKNNPLFGRSKTKVECISKPKSS